MLNSNLMSIINQYGKEFLIQLLDAFQLKYRVFEYDREFESTGPPISCVRLEVDNVGAKSLIYGMDGYYCDFLFDDEGFIRIEIMYIE